MATNRSRSPGGIIRPTVHSPGANDTTGEIAENDHPNPKDTSAKGTGVALNLAENANNPKEKPTTTPTTPAPSRFTRSGQAGLHQNPYTGKRASHKANDKASKMPKKDKGKGQGKHTKAKAKAARAAEMRRELEDHLTDTDDTPDTSSSGGATSEEAGITVMPAPRKSTNSTTSNTPSEVELIQEADPIFEALTNADQALVLWDQAVEHRQADMETLKTEAEIKVAEAKMKLNGVKGEHGHLYNLTAEEAGKLDANFADIRERHKKVRQEQKLKARLEATKKAAKANLDAKLATVKAQQNKPPELLNPTPGGSKDPEAGVARITGESETKKYVKTLNAHKGPPKTLAFGQKPTREREFDQDMDYVALELGKILDPVEFMKDELRAKRITDKAEVAQKISENCLTEKKREAQENAYEGLVNKYNERRPDIEKGFHRLRAMLKGNADKLDRINASITKREARLTSTTKKEKKAKGINSQLFHTAREFLNSGTGGAADLSHIPKREPKKATFKAIPLRFSPYSPPEDASHQGQGLGEDSSNTTITVSDQSGASWQQGDFRVKFKLEDHPMEAMKKHGTVTPISWASCFQDGNDDLFYDVLVKKEHRDKHVVIPTFSGEASEVSFRDFQVEFEWAVNRKRSIEWGDKLHYLKKSLRGPPLQSIADCAYNRTGYMYALYILEKDWGGFDKDLHALQKRFMEQPRVDFINTAGLRRMRDGLRQIVRRMGHMEEPFKSNWEATMFPAIYQVMTDKTRFNWESYMRREHLKRETIHDLENWLEEVFEYRKTKRMVEAISGTTKQSRVTVAATDEVEGVALPTEPLSEDEDEVAATQTWEGCLGCHKTNHRLPNCVAFKKKSAHERWEWASKNRVCYACLDGQHASKDCPQPKACSTCGLKHHNLVHLASRSSQEEFSAEDKKLIKKLLTELRAKEESEVETVDNAATDLLDPRASPEREGKRDGEMETQLELRTAIGTLFGVVPVWVSNTKDFKNAKKINMTLDTASKKTFTSNWLPDALGVRTTETVQRLRTVNGVKTHKTRKGKYFVRSLDGLTEFETWGATADLPTGFKPTKPEVLYKAFPHLRKLGLPEPAERDSIDILLGMDNYRMFAGADVETEGPDDPLIRRTPFGLSCLYSYLDSRREAVNLAIDSEDGGDRAEVVEVAATMEAEGASPQAWQAVEKLLEASWSTDLLGIVPKTVIYDKPWSAAERQAVESLEAGLKRHEDGRYITPIPWRNGEPHLEFNGAQTKRITAKMEASMSAEARTGCDKVFEEYAQNDFLQPLEEETVMAERKGYFCTWFPVMRPDKATTKVRPVIHCAQKFGSVVKKSINDEILAGPKLHNDLLAVLLRFRRRAVVLGGDIKQMYMMYHLTPRDQAYHGIWWKGKPWRFTRLPFGNCAAPFIALYVLNKHIKNNMEEPLRSRLLEGLYVDDVLLSFDTEDEAINARRAITKTLAACGMRICKWFSNSARVRESIPEADRAHEVTIGEDTESATLGLKYFPEADTMGVRKPVIETESITRRTVTSDLCKLYDVMGWVDPVTLSGRRATQELAVLRAIRSLEWDQDLAGAEDELVQAAVDLWKQYCEGVEGVEDIRIPRQLSTIKGREEIHVFNDGSKKAIASTAYLRVEAAPEVEVRQICSKRRLNPIEARSIPQIELNASTMGARLGSYLGEILGVEIVKYWTDNICTLYWIRRHARQKDVYVGHRVTEITTLSSPYDWRHCPTDQNPADLPTRGCTAAVLQELKFWLNGPEFLKGAEETWPDKPITITEDDVALLNTLSKSRTKEELLTEQVLATWEEEKPPDVHVTRRGTLWPMVGSGAAALHPDQRQAATHAAKLAKAWQHLKWETQSKWHVHVRGLARAISWVRTRRGGPPGSVALGEAFTILMICGQQEGFAEDLAHWRKNGRFREKSFLQEVNGHFDVRGRLRAYGRAEKQTYLTLEERRPLLVPEGHVMWSLLVHHHHREQGHEFSLAKLGPWMNLRFRVHHLNQSLKNLLKACVECAKLRGQPYSQLMGQLPDLELDCFRPFRKVALDYGGPFPVRVNRSTWKAYVLIAVCQQSKAVNLEACVNLDTDNLLYALTIMASSVGTPEEATSDNGTQFVKAAKVMAAADPEWSVASRLDKIDWPRVVAETEMAGLKRWNFSMPHAPQENGLAEAMVKLAKEQLYAVLKGRTLKLEQFRALLKRAQMSINQRPLAVVEVEGAEQVITPNHLLMGRASLPLVNEVDDSVLCYVKQYQEMIELHQKFVDSWKGKVQEALHSRPKWQAMRQNLEIDDVVLMVMDDKRRHEWPLARVLSVQKDSQGLVRDVVVGVRDQKSNELHKYGRNIRQLVPVSTFRRHKSASH